MNVESPQPRERSDTEPLLITFGGNALAITTEVMNDPRFTITLIIQMLDPNQPTPGLEPGAKDFSRQLKISALNGFVKYVRSTFDRPEEGITPISMLELMKERDEDLKESVKRVRETGIRYFRMATKPLRVRFLENGD